MVLSAIAVVLGAQDRPAEIVIVATVHDSHRFNPDYSPAHIRALLEKIKPDAIAIEEMPDWVDQRKLFWTFLPETYVALGYAAKKRIPVVGVDSIDFNEFDKYCLAGRKQRAEQSEAARRKQAERVVVESGNFMAQQLFQDTQWGRERAIVPTHMNVAPESTDPAEIDRENRITTNIVNAARRFVGKRIAVVLGADHLGRQRKRLEREPVVNLIDALPMLPLSPQEVEAAWDRADYHLLLGTGLDSIRVPGTRQVLNHQRTRELLDRLKRTEPASAMTRYYEAMWNLTFERYNEAMTFLESIVQQNDEAKTPVLPCPEWNWPPFEDFRDKAIFAIAVIHDLEGRHPLAATIYEKLLKTLPSNRLQPRNRGAFAYFDLRSYLQSLIDEGYQGGLRECSRAFEYERSWTSMEFPGDAWPRWPADAWQ